MSILQKLPNGVYVLCIPRQITKAMGWDKGDRIDISVGGANQLKLSRVEESKESKHK